MKTKATEKFCVRNTYLKRVLIRCATARRCRDFSKVEIRDGGSRGNLTCLQVPRKSILLLGGRIR